jgi:hypothetical protein
MIDFSLLFPMSDLLTTNFYLLKFITILQFLKNQFLNFLSFTNPHDFIIHFHFL